MNQDPTTGIKIGDVVCYKASFLRSVGAHTGEMPAVRATVDKLTRVSPHTDTVRVDGTDRCSGIRLSALASNLSIVDSKRGIPDE